MNLKEEYDLSANLQYRYLTPENQFEAAILVKLSQLYPNIFDLEIEHKSYHFQEYRLQLRIGEKK